MSSTRPIDRLALGPLHALIAAASIFSAVSTTVAQRAPMFCYESILDTFCHERNGTIRFGDSIVAFAPEGPFAGMVALMGPNREIVAQFEFHDSIEREGVFGKVSVRGPAEVQLTEPGIYTIVHVVGGQPVTRMPVRLLRVDSNGDDPFDPQPTFRFDGHWRTHAHLTMGSLRDEPVPDVTMWIGGIDLPADLRNDRFFVELIRDGEVVAHGKHRQGHIASGHFKRTTVRLFHPHEERASANAEPFMLKDWLVDGSYELKVTRGSDGTMIRSFDFDVADGKIVPLPEATLDHEPATDRLLPRVSRKGTSTFEMVEAIWIRHGGNAKP